MKMSIKEKILDKILTVADKIAGFPSLKRLKIELMFLAYMAIASSVASGFSFYFGDWIQAIIFSVVFASSCFMFISRSVMYKKVQFLNKFESGLDTKKLKEVQNAR